MKSVIFTDESPQSWHVAQLQTALAKQGRTSVVVNLVDCLLDFSGSTPQITAPKITALNLSAMLSVVLVRGIAGGSMQQVVTRLNVLHMLAAQGTRVVNSGRAIERTVDKAMTTFLLAQAGIATPATWVCESRNFAHEIINKQLNLNQKLLLKPLFGSQGKGIRLIENVKTMPLPFDAYVDGVFYLQQYIAAPCDYRVLVVNNEPVAAMRRTGQSWLNNVAQGAQCEKIDDTDILQIATQAAQALEIDYCGVDIIRDADGKLWVLEVNSIPAWRGLQSVTDFNIADVLVSAALEAAA